jgi:hypothetical protein
VSTASHVGKSPARNRLLTGGEDVCRFRSARRAMMQCGIEVGYRVVGLQGSRIVAVPPGKVAGRIGRVDLELTRLDEAFC